MGITLEMKQEAEKQIEEKRKEVEYDTRDYTIDFLMQKYREGEFYIPDQYQRQYIWNEAQKVRLIESILLGLPIPFMFFSDTKDGPGEIIDGAQRTQSIEEFTENILELNGLKKLTALNGFKFEHIPGYFQRKFLKTNLRVIMLSDKTTLETRQEIFNRINTGGEKAKSIEIRRGTYTGDFMNFVRTCTENLIFRKVSPVSATAEMRYENLELVLRFFAFLNNYKKFNHRVDEFLDEYVEENQHAFDKSHFQKEFESMVNFVNTYFPYGCKKTLKAKSTPRVRFEAIAVGVGLALREKPDLVPFSMEWLDSEEFKKHTTTHASNSFSRVSGRIEYVRDCLLAGDKNAGNN